MPDPMGAKTPSSDAATPRPPWDGWDGTHSALPPGVRAIARTLLHARPHPLPRADPPPLPATRLSAADLAALREVCTLSLADDELLRHLGGKSTPDLLRRRMGIVAHAPDGVAFPAGHDDVAALLRVCDTRGIAVVPFGGGTSVVGGVEPDPGPHRAVVVLDTERMAGLLAVDETSRLARFGAGTTGPQAERLLAAHGFTLGHFPQSYAYATIGGFAATRSAGQASRGYGRFDELVHALRAACPAGDLALGRAPASAAGPDLRQLLLGSEGALGVITEVTVRIRPRPVATVYAAWTLPDLGSGVDAVRELTQRGVHPAVIRLSDAVETRVNAALGGHLSRLNGCLAVATFEGRSTAEAESTRTTAAVVFASHGGRDRGADPARSWERGRFSAPAMRDALLDTGILAETLETATTWTNLVTLKAAVTNALTDALAASGTPPIVMCHLSHVYPDGASLYFTVVAALTADPIEQWARAKDAASRAILATGGTISHHHAVGRDHRPYLESEIGLLGTQILQAVKHSIDPHGIMNPGALVVGAVDSGL